MQLFCTFIFMLVYPKFTFDHAHLQSNSPTFLFGWLHCPFCFVEKIFEGCFSFYTISSSYTFHSYTFHSYTFHLYFFIRILFFHSSISNFYAFHSYTFHSKNFHSSIFNFHAFHSYTFHSKNFHSFILSIRVLFICIICFESIFSVVYF